MNSQSSALDEYKCSASLTRKTALFTVNVLQHLRQRTRCALCSRMFFMATRVDGLIAIALCIKLDLSHIWR